MVITVGKAAQDAGPVGAFVADERIPETPVGRLFEPEKLSAVRRSARLPVEAHGAVIADRKSVPQGEIAGQRRRGGLGGHESTRDKTG